MTPEEYELNEFGSSILIKALKNCSETTRNEVEKELEKLMGGNISH